MSLVTLILLLFCIHSSLEVVPDFFLNSSNYNYKVEGKPGNFKEYMLEILHGKIPFQIREAENLTYDKDFIYQINNNSVCPYVLNSLNNPVFDGVFLGAGINLLSFTEKEMKEILRNAHWLPILDPETAKIPSLCNKKGTEASKAVNDIGCFGSTTIEFFNAAVLKHIVESKINKTFGYNNKFHNTFYNAFISLYISMGDTNYSEVYNNYNNTPNISYLTENMLEGIPYSRLIQSKLMSLMDGDIKYNNNYLLFVVPPIFGDEEKSDIDNFISNFSSIIKSNTSENSIEISRKDLDNTTLKYDTYSNNDFNKLFNLKDTSSNTIDLNKTFTEIVNTFKEKMKSDIYQNKIVVFLTNSKVEYTSDAKTFIYYLQTKESIQTIPVILNCKNYSIDEMEYSIFVDKFNTNINLRKILFAISNMHNYIYLSESIPKITKESIKNSDLDTPIFFELNFDQSNKNITYYEVEFEFNKNVDYKYNIFLSHIHPYPSIKNNSEKILVYYNNPNPKLLLNSSQSQLYISVECIGQFNLNIKKKDANENINISDYNFDETDFKSPVIFTTVADGDSSYQTFGEDYILKTDAFPRDWTFPTFLKYTMRGIDYYNTEGNDFFDRNLFLYLFGNVSLINRIYRDSNKNYYFGRNFNLSNLTPLMIKNKKFDKLIINKLYYFLQNSTIIYNETAPGISFDNEEIKQIYGITHKEIISALQDALRSESLYTPFDQQNPSIKFVMYCLYFMSPNDKLITKRIQELGLIGIQRYTETITYLVKLENNNQYSRLYNPINFLITWLQHFDHYSQINEKVLISIIVGQSYILDQYGYSFIDDFLTRVNKKTTKVALSAYDTYNKKITNIIPIYKNPTKNTQKLDLIKEYQKLYDEEQRQKFYNGTKEMEFDKIVDYSLSEFSKFDHGIKKVVIIVADENCITEKNYYFNNKLTKLNYNKHRDLDDNEIHLILATTKNFEKGEIHDLFTLPYSNQIPYTIDENYFHYQNINKTEYFMEGLVHLLTQSIIPLKINKRIINDIFDGGISYYKVNYIENDSNVVKIKADLSAFNVFASFYHPFPYAKEFLITNSQKTEKNILSIYSDESLKFNSFYLAFEAKTKKEKEIIEIYSCNSKTSSDPNNFVCNLESTSTLQWYLFAFFVSCFILGLTVYNCKYSFREDQKQFNIFE